MSDINWNEGAVCYGDGRQWFVNTGYESDKFELVNNDGTRKYSLYGILNFPKNFQLNEIIAGNFIPASELDTEQKYNEVVEVFELFGFEFEIKKCDFVGYSYIIDNEYSNLKVNSDGYLVSGYSGNRKLTYHQIIAIGKLKRMMLERERSGGGYINEIPIPDNTTEFDAIVSSKSVGIGDYFSGRVGTAKALNIEINGKPVKPKRRNKSKQAYDILKSLDYEYDLVKQRWYKKQYID